MTAAVPQRLASPPGDAALDSILAEIVAAARAAWPTVEISTERFLAYLADRLPAGIAPDAALGKLHATDLYLACACADGDPSALAAFDLHCLTAVDRALSRLGMGFDVVNEVKQRLRHALLVAKDGPPRIVGFSGRGALRSWVRVMAVRDALAVAKPHRPHVALDEDRLVDLACAGATPETDYFKRMYRREFELAFRAAIQTLSVRERTLLRQHFLDGVAINELGRLYHVHRVTAGKWLEHARDTLLTTTRAHLMERLDVPRAEVESILRLVLSQLEISVRSLLGRA